MTTLIPKYDLKNGDTTPTGAVNRAINLKLAEFVSVKDFGAVGDGTTDDTAAIQNTLDYAIYFGRCKVYIPAGTYKISSTLQVGYGFTNYGVNPFTSCLIQGDGYMYRAEAPFSGTAIITTFSNAPAINIQSCRHTVLRDFSIKGLNYDYVLNNNLGNIASDIPDLSASAWVDPALAANAASRYAPYAAISIDAYAGAQKAAPNSYPDVVYPSWAGTQTQYNKYGISSEIIFEHLWIGGFAVAVVDQPNGTDGNGDFLRLSNCQIEFCQYGLSIGHTQARTMGINACTFGNVHTSLATNVHGNQAGKPSFISNASEFDRQINVISTNNSAEGGPTVFEGCYGEVIYALGSYGTSASGVTDTLNIIGCDWSFDSQTTRGAPRAIISGATKGNINIQGTWFSSFIGNLLFEGSQLTFTNNNVYLNNWAPFRSGSPDDSYPIPVFDAFPLYSVGLVQLNNCNVINANYTFEAYSVTDGTFTGSYNLSNKNYSNRNTPIYRQSSLIYSATTVSNGNKDPGITNPLLTYDYVLGGTQYTISMTGRTATITSSISYSADQYNVFGLNPGDVINYQHSTGTYVFYISARTGNVITAKLQNGFDSSGNCLVTLDNTANLYTYIGRYYLNAQYQLGTFTSASANITAIGDSSGTFAFDGVVGDAFLSDPVTNAFAAVTDTRITAISSPTVTMNGTATKTQTGRLPILIRKAPANV